MQRLQPNFMTDDIRSFMYTKHNEGNSKLRIFSFLPQGQSIQQNFMNDSIKELPYIPDNQTRTQNPNNQNNDIKLGFTSNTKFTTLQLRQHKFCNIHIQTPQ